MPRRSVLILSSLLVLLVVANVAQFFLYERSIAEQRAIVTLLANTSAELENLRAINTIQDGAEKLHDVQKNLDARLAELFPPHAAEQAREDADVSTAPELLTVGALQNISALLTGVAGEYVLLVEKTPSLLHLFRFEKNSTRLIKTFPCVVGKNKHDKQREGDMATPIGVYFLVSYLPDESLAELYGAGAFVLNYPSLFDYKLGKEGRGIWLHGHPRNQKLGEDKTSTRGCVVVKNKDLLELTKKVQVMKTPLIIVDRLSIVSTQQAAKTKEEIMKFLDTWRLAWESRDTERFISLYAPGYINNLQMNLQEFRAQKEKTAALKRYIKVKVSGVFILTTGRNGDIFVVKFKQNYRSDQYTSASNKLLYIQKQNDVWKVVGESVY